MSVGNVCPQEVELPLAVQELEAMKRLRGLFTVIGHVTAGKHDAKLAGREKNNANDLSPEPLAKFTSTGGDFPGRGLFPVWG
jgi:hypothetical protein